MACSHTYRNCSNASQRLFFFMNEVSFFFKAVRFSVDFPLMDRCDFHFSSSTILFLALGIKLADLHEEDSLIVSCHALALVDHQSQKAFRSSPERRFSVGYCDIFHVEDLFFIHFALLPRFRLFPLHFLSQHPFILDVNSVISTQWNVRFYLSCLIYRMSSNID